MKSHYVRCGAQTTAARQVRGGGKWHEEACKAMYLKVLMKAGRKDGLCESEFKNRVSK